MSSINSMQIASSVAQGALQQSQANRASEAGADHAARRAQQMKELIQRHLESVEDSYETTDEHLTVREHDEGNERREPDDDHARREPAADEPPADPDAEPAPEDAEPPARRHLDITA